MVKIKIEPGIRYFNLSEKLNMMIQSSVAGDSVDLHFKVYKRNQQVQTNILLLTSE